MKLIIAGSRNLTSVHLVYAAIKQFNIKLEDIEEVVSGCARGIDQAGSDWAFELGFVVKAFPADWGNNGRGAGYIRNAEMAEYGDVLLAIWDGHSKGTLHMITEMQKRNKPVWLMEVYLK